MIIGTLTGKKLRVNVSRLPGEGREVAGKVDGVLTSATCDFEDCCRGGEDSSKDLKDGFFIALSGGIVDFMASEEKPNLAKKGHILGFCEFRLVLGKLTVNCCFWLVFVLNRTMSDTKLDALLEAVADMKKDLAEVKKDTTDIRTRTEKIEKRTWPRSRRIPLIFQQGRKKSKNGWKVSTQQPKTHDKIGDVFEVVIRNELRLEYGQKFARSFLVSDGRGLTRISIPRGFSGFKEYDDHCAKGVDLL